MANGQILPPVFNPMGVAPPAPAPATVDLPPEQSNVLMTEDGGALIDIDPGREEQKEVPFGGNLAEVMDEGAMAVLASELVEEFEGDRNSRAEWEKAYLIGLDLLGMTFEERDTPWAGACGVFHPMLAESVVRFQAQAIQEVFPAKGPAKTKVTGDKSADRMRKSQRVQEYLNYLTTEEMSEYRNETERLLFSLPIAGSAFRKIYYDETRGRPCAMFVPAEDFVVSYGTADLETCPRATHIMKRTANELRKQQVKGFYRDIDLPEPTIDLSEVKEKYQKLEGQEEDFDLDGRYTLLEMQVERDLDGFEDPDGIALPYVITIDKSSTEILSIRRNWLEDDPERQKRDHFVQYQYLPGLGYYGFGLVHMIGGLSKSATSLLRQLIDSGTLANLPGGLKSRGLRIKGDDSPIMPGEFRDVDIHSGAIRDNITFLPYKEPSTVLYQLLGDLVSEGRRFASAADLKASDINGEAPVGTTLALLEREMKVLSAVQARIHASMGKELKIVTGIVRDKGPQKYPYPVDGDHTIAEDFDESIGVIPVSDPNAGTMAQRIMQYQAALQLAATKSEIYDEARLHRQMLEVLGIADADKIVPVEEDLLPTDPITENMNILNGKPVKAFLYQDHEAHIQAHMSMAQNPQVQGLIKKNPKAKMIMAAGADHLNEHIALAYRAKIEQELGVQLPSPEEALPPDIELRLSRLVAPASAQLTGKAQKQAQAEENAKKQQDPIIQMQQEELRQKAQKLADERADKAEKNRIAAKKAADARELGESKLVADVVDNVAEHHLKKEAQKAKDKDAGFKAGLELGKTILDKSEGSNGTGSENKGE